MKLASQPWNASRPHGRVFPESGRPCRRSIEDRAKRRPNCPRHLHMVEEYGFRSDYDRDALGEYFLANWYRLFGPLRESKALEVPSDQIRKELMVSRLLDLIEMRAEYATERALH
jgi:hypothetical protein